VSRPLHAVSWNAAHCSAPPRCRNSFSDRESGEPDILPAGYPEGARLSQTAELARVKVRIKALTEKTVANLTGPPRRDGSHRPNDPLSQHRVALRDFGDHRGMQPVDLVDAAHRLLNSDRSIEARPELISRPEE
jgi:hypothetical protein